jgi:hypothetical protein
MINISTNYIPPAHMEEQAINPTDMISDFFWQYPLAETQSRMWSWYIDAVQNPEVNAGDLVLFLEKLSKLIVAAHAVCKDGAGDDHKSGDYEACRS